MSKILTADFARLFKSRIFWTGMITMCGFAAFMVFMNCVNEGGNEDIVEMDSAIFVGSILMPLVSAVFSGIFLGTEYSDGTMRNKLIVGHKRSSVYFSDLIVCCTGLVLMNTTFVLTIIAAGIPLLGMVASDITNMLIVFGIVSAAICAWSSVLVLISLLISSKSSGVVTAIILSFIMMFSAIALYSRYTEPEYFQGDNGYADANGKIVFEMEKNPGYLTGTKRKVYETLLDVLPSGQFMQISEGNDGNKQNKLVYSLTIITAVSACGLLCFRKKDLK